MKNIIKSALIAPLFILAIVIASQAAEEPKLLGYVNDFADILTQEDEHKIYCELKSFDDRTSVRISVVTVQHLRDFSTKAFAQAKGNNVALIVSANEKKAQIEVSGGLKPSFGDSAVKKIIQKDILPSFKSNRVVEGTIAGICGIMRGIDNRTAVFAKKKPESSKSVDLEKTKKFIKIFLPAFLTIIFAVGVILFIVRREVRKQALIERKMEKRRKL